MKTPAGVVVSMNVRHRSWSLLALLACGFLVLAGPAAAQLPPGIEDPGGSGGPCGDPCYGVPPTTVPSSGPIVTVGGRCTEGGASFVCDTTQCIGTFWMPTPCRGDTVCVVWGQDTCVWGYNGGELVDFVNHQTHVPASTRPYVPYLPDAPDPAKTFGYGGSCDASVHLSCDYAAPAGLGCMSSVFPPEFDNRCPPRMYCPAEVDGVGCVFAVALYRGGLCAWVHPALCAPTCEALARANVVICQDAW